MSAGRKNLKPGIYIADFNEEGVFLAANPQILADAHASWKKDMSRFGPWDCNPPGIWCSRSYKGPAAIWVSGECTSTMEAARVLIRQERMASWSSVIALHQTAGRGQRQRSWMSPAGNIYGTWYWILTTSSASEKLLKYRHIASLLAGAILVSVFREMGVDVRLKWPNDIILNDRKLCGILVEDREGRMLVGIGANLAWAPGSNLLGDDFVLPATSLEASEHMITPLCFWTKLMDSGKKRLDEITDKMTPETFLESLEKDLAWIGREIRIRTEASEPYQAVLEGFAPDGGLEIMRNGDRQVIYTGTIRPL